MLKKDLRSNKVIAVTLCLFITLAAMLVGGAFSIIADMTGAMNHFFDKAKPIHYMQMISGDFDQKAIDAFSANHKLVTAQQTVELLGIDNNYIFYGKEQKNYPGSVMENSFVTQSLNFDYLLDDNNKVAKVKPGEIAVPLYAIESYDLKIGDEIIIRHGGFVIKFVISGFIRDSQMNASLVSSKRFLINQEDFEVLKANTGESEYLIEFQLSDPSKTGELESAYLSAGLPSGVAITLPMIKLMNTMTGGLAIVVLLLASILLIIIAIMCLRFTIMATLEEEYREIGVMKAIGLDPTYISKLYKTKYYLIGGVSCGSGFLLSLVFSSLFTETVSRYMGKADISVWTYALPLSGAFLVFIIITGALSFVIHRLKRISVVEAIRGNNREGAKNGISLPLYKNKAQNVNILLGIRDVLNRIQSYKTPIIVFILCTFLVIVPVNFLNTLKSRDFAGYFGVGYCDALITLNYSEDISVRYDQLLETLKTDKEVTSYAGKVTATYKTLNQDGEYENINIQNGDFTTFPLPYLEGAAPQSDSEIALSYLNARNYGKKVGDGIEIIIDNKMRRLTVSGIYQDLTNGGKSAQALLPYESENVLWYSVAVGLSDTADKAGKIASFGELFAPAKVADIDGYLAQTFSSTIELFGTVTFVVVLLSSAVAVLITALFLKMILTKDHRQITIMKGLGFTAADIQLHYVSAAVLSLLIGLVLGTIGANTLGELLVGALMSGMGASKISFIIDPLLSFIVCPLLLLAAVIATTLLSARSINKCDNYLVSE